MNMLNRFLINSSHKYTWGAYEFFGMMLTVFMVVPFVFWAIVYNSTSLWIGTLSISTVGSIVISSYNYTQRGYATVWHILKFLLRCILLAPMVFAGIIFVINYWFLYLMHNYVIYGIKEVLNYRIIKGD